MERIALSVNPDVLTQVDARAQALGMSRAMFFRQAVGLFLAQTNDVVWMDVADSPQQAVKKVLNVEDVPRGDCAHPNQRRRKVASVGRTRCLDCGILMA